MADYTNAKMAQSQGSIAAHEGGSYDRLVPIITPEFLRKQFLFGIPLESGWSHAGAAGKLTDADLKEYIENAIANIEVEYNIVVYETPMTERLPFDERDFRACAYMQLPKRPVAAITKLAMESPNMVEFGTIPLEWVETGGLEQGQINLIPLSPASAGSTFSAFALGTIFAGGMTVLTNYTGHLPAYFKAYFIAGFKDNKVPRTLNNLIGATAARDILQVLGPTYARSGAQSKSIDGLSQSSSNPGAAMFKQRLDELEGKIERWGKAIQNQYGASMYLGAF